MREGGREGEGGGEGEGGREGRREGRREGSGVQFNNSGEGWVGIGKAGCNLKRTTCMPH